MSTIKAYGAVSATAPVAPLTISRRSLTPRDVKIDILFCGICHSDLHYARNEWADSMATVYPCVPGHEIIGRVVEVGPAVTRVMRGPAGIRPACIRPTSTASVKVPVHGGCALTTIAYRPGRR